jgi:hypothetical protein
MLRLALCNIPVRRQQAKGSPAASGAFGDWRTGSCFQVDKIVKNGVYHLLIPMVDPV